MPNGLQGFAVTEAPRNVAGPLLFIYLVGHGVEQWIWSSLELDVLS